jgi:hypothetical protein
MNSNLGEFQATHAFILCGAAGLKIGKALWNLNKHIAFDFSIISMRQEAQHCRIEPRLKAKSAECNVDPPSGDWPPVKGVRWGS